VSEERRVFFLCRFVLFFNALLAEINRVAFLALFFQLDSVFRSSRTPSLKKSLISKRSPTSWVSGSGARAKKRIKTSTKRTTRQHRQLPRQSGSPLSSSLCPSKRRSTPALTCTVRSLIASNNFVHETAFIHLNSRHFFEAFDLLPRGTNENGKNSSSQPRRPPQKTALLLSCYPRCTNPFRPCCVVEHDAFWACYREKRRGAEEK